MIAPIRQRRRASPPRPTCAGLRSHLALLALWATLAGAPMGGCVHDPARTEALRQRNENTTPTLPSEPVASPVIGGTTASRVAVALQALGTIEYDGLAVPVVAPDGNWVAAQQAPAPPAWQRLALDRPPGQHAGPLAGVTLQRLRPGTFGTAQAVEVFDLQAPILLGRDASTHGVLVESPRPDGTRWIGLASWPPGPDAGDPPDAPVPASVRWLVREPAVCAHAVLAGNDAVLFSRRAVGDGRFELVLQNADGSQRTLSLPDASLVYPLMAPDLRHATCLAVDHAGAIALLLIDLAAGHGQTLGRIVRRDDLASSGSLAGAAQIVAASQSAVHGLAGRDAFAQPPAQADAPTEPLLGPIVYHPAMRRCVAIDASRRRLVVLAPQSVAAVDAGDGRALCSTPKGLVLWTPGPQPGRGTATRVLSEDYLPRRTASTSRPFVLLAPSPSSATTLRAFGLAPASPP